MRRLQQCFWRHLQLQRNRQMVGQGRRHRAFVGTPQAVADQDVVDRPLRPPAGEGVDHAGGRLQAGGTEQRLHFRAVDRAVEVAHQHRMRMVVQQIGDEGELRGARRGAKREVDDGDHQPVVAIAEPRQQDAAAAEAAGQRVVDDFARFELAQQAVGAGGDAANPAVGLVAPVIEAGALGEVMGLVGETRAQAAGVAFVEADDVLAAGQLGDEVQAATLVAGRQHV